MGILDGIVDWLATQIMNLLDLLSSSVLGALGCDMSTFKRYFPAAETMYEIFVWLGVGLLLLNLVWSLFKNYAAGLDVETEDPVKLLFRSGVFLLCIWYADDIVNLALRIGGTPYHWVLDSDLPAVQFGSFNSVLLVIIGVLANGSVALIALILPYNMRDVAALLPLHIRRRRAVSIDADCPFCGDTKGKLNINFEKQVFNCNRCRTHGGMVELYAKFFGVSNTQANAEIFSIVCRHETPRIAPTPIASPKELPKEASRADAQAIDQTFRTLLAMLPLAESHRSDLYRRGLNDDQIEQYLYRSVPAFGYRALTGQLLQMGCHLEGRSWLLPGRAEGLDPGLQPSAYRILCPRHFGRRSAAGLSDPHGSSWETGWQIHMAFQCRAKWRRDLRLPGSLRGRSGRRHRLDHRRTTESNGCPLPVWSQLSGRSRSQSAQRSAGFSVIAQAVRMPHRL